MASQPQITNNQTWSESLNPKLTRRLLQPLVSPGVIGTQIAGSIISRAQAMSNRLPLMAKLLQRQHPLEGQSAPTVPIVYAQPIRGTGEPVEKGHLTSGGKEVRGGLSLKATGFEIQKQTSVQKSKGSNSQDINLDSPRLSSREKPIPHTPTSTPSEASKSGTKPLIVQAKFANLTKRTSRRADSESEPIVSGFEPSGKTRLSSNSSLPIVQAKRINSQSLSSSEKTLVKLPNSPNPSSLQRKEGTQNPSPSRKGIGREVNPHNLNNPISTLPADSKLLLASPENLIQSSLIQPSPEQPVVKEFVSNQSKLNLPLIQPTPEQPVVKEFVSNQSKLNLPLIQPSPQQPVVKEFVSNQSKLNLPLIQRSPERPVVREMSGTNSPQLPVPLIFSASGVNGSSFSGNGLGVNSSPSIAHNGSGVIQRMSSTNGVSVSNTSLEATNVIQRASENTSGATTNSQSVEDIDVDELVDKVQHKLMQRLTIESERRGLTQWH
ncbi:MAG: hypothetical protein F6K58_19475 [Symploca sp. SIO2E9]|nr:hypothetical protein [Symploca sp. SIO2E9]